MKLVTFATMEEAIEHMDESRKAADAAVDPYVDAQIGAFFVRVASGYLIYGEILDPSKPLDEGEHDPEYLEEIAEEGKIYDRPHMKHYRFARCFSAACVEGELGDIHVATIAHILTKDQFELAQKLEWPQQLEDLGVLLNVQPPQKA